MPAAVGEEPMPKPISHAAGGDAGVDLGAAADLDPVHLGARRVARSSPRPCAIMNGLVLRKKPTLTAAAPPRAMAGTASGGGADASASMSAAPGRDDHSVIMDVPLSVVCRPSARRGARPRAAAGRARYPSTR